MPRAVYTGHEILDAPQGWEPTSASYGWNWSDFQEIWITTGSVGVRETQQEENTVFPLAYRYKNSWKLSVCENTVISREQRFVRKRWI